MDHPRRLTERLREAFIAGAEEDSERRLVPRSRHRPRRVPAVRTRAKLTLVAAARPDA